jgi:hypothetical protein
VPPVVLALLVVLALFGLLLVAAAVGYFAGYPPPRFAAGVLNGKEQAVLLACADTLFPERGVMPLTGSEAGVVEFMDNHLLALPKDKRFQVRLLFAFIEHSPWLLGPARRFTAQSRVQRTAFLRRLSLSNIYFLRVCFLSLRTLTCMAYLAHPEIIAAVGCLPATHPYRVGGGS